MTDMSIFNRFLLVSDRSITSQTEHNKAASGFFAGGLQSTVKQNWLSLNRENTQTKQRLLIFIAYKTGS